MGFLDLKTILTGYALSSAICAAVMASLWWQHKRRSPEISLWLVDYVAQFVAMVLLVLRGVIPDFLSVVVANVLVIWGTIVLYDGLRRYVGKQGRQVHNYVMLAVFTAVHVYLTYVSPSLALRGMNSALGLMFVCVQVAWLMLRGVGPELRSATRPTGLVFSAFALAAAVHVRLDLSRLHVTDFFGRDVPIVPIILVDQMLYIALTFSLLLMVSYRLQTELEDDVAQRELAQEALKKSETKFAVAFQNVPDAVLITLPEDGTIIEANESCLRVVGYTREELIGQTTLGLGLFDDPADRQRFVARLTESGKVAGFEATLRKKSGELFPAVATGEVVDLGGRSSILVVVRDATEHKLAEERLKDLSNRDSLTGLLNQRAFYSAASERLDELEGSSAALLFLDLDGLKAINDEYGHQAGDEALVTMTAALRDAFRESDIVARLGGDEFAVLAVSRAKVPDHLLVARLAEALDDRNAASGLPFDVSVSVGVAWWDPDLEHHSLRALIRAADARMYEEKRGSRAASERPAAHTKDV